MNVLINPHPNPSPRGRGAICLLGPTGAGKTKIAIECTQKIPCDIISVDSSMVYRGMDIGTAKPTKEELAIAPHRLIDIKNPDENYSAGEFRRDAIREIEDILAHERIPLLVGGTMLYFKALQQGIAQLPTADKEIREKIATMAEKTSWEKMHAKLTQIDPESAARIHPNDPQRIGRALEVYEQTGKTMTEFFAEQKDENPPYNFINIALAPASRATLNERITKRFDKMLNDGLIEETKHLLEKTIVAPVGADHRVRPCIIQRVIGYRQICQYLAGELTYDEMREKAIIATRQLAKRQLTWLRNWPDLKWFNSEDDKITEKILAWIK